MNRRKLFILAVALITSTGCVREIKEGCIEDICQVRLSLGIDEGTQDALEIYDGTKGALAEDCSDLKSVQVCTYENGLLVSSDRYVGQNSIVMNLTKGKEYDLFLLGNTESFTAPDSEVNIYQVDYTISNASDMDKNGAFPAAEQIYGVIADEEFQNVTIYLTKLVARIRLSVNTEALPGLEVKNVRILQSPLTLYPFSRNGSKVGNSGQVADGDYATSEECEVLNSGGEILLYTFENRQGTLLPDNEDSWGKVPEAIGDASGLCTYVEMDCEFNDTSPFSGTVKYRFYLGNDEHSNFDVIGGKEHQVSVVLSNSGLEKDSWKVVADYESRVSTFSRLEVEGVKKLSTGSSTRLSVRKYTDTYIDGILSSEDTVGEVIENSDVLWELPEYDKTEASISQDGVLTGISAGTVTVNVSLISDSSISGAGAIVIRNAGAIGTDPDWDGAGNDIAIEI